MNRSWFACHQPERPTDAYVRWHYGHCTPCHLKAQAVAAQAPGDPHVDWLLALTRPRAAS